MWTKFVFHHDFADFSHRKFPKMFRQSGKSHSKLFIQENCPKRNCVKACGAVMPSAFAIQTYVCAQNYFQYQWEVVILI